MSKLNLPPFYVGQKVVYITGISMPKNSIHVVLGIWRAPCGCWVVDVSESPNYGQYKTEWYLLCASCGNHFQVSKPERQGIFASSFRAIDEAKPPLMTFTQIKETEKEEILILN